MNEYELRRRLGLGPDVAYDFTVLRDQYWLVGKIPIILNEGTPFEEPFGVTLALAYGERLADEVLR
jgi:hypothetical protein